MKNLSSNYLFVVLAVVGLAYVALEASGRSVPDTTNTVVVIPDNAIENTSTTATSTTTSSSTSTTTTTQFVGSIDINLECETIISTANNAKKGKAELTVDVVNSTQETFKGRIEITPGSTVIELTPVERGIRNTQVKVFTYEIEEIASSGKQYYGAYLYKENGDKALDYCFFDRQIPSTTTATTTTTTTTTTTVPTTTTTASSTSYNTNTHILLTLTGLEDNPYLCEIPGTGVIERYSLSYWGRCAEYTGNIPNYDNIFIPAWYNGESYTTKDPNWCYYDGEIIGCNVLRRIKTNQDINRTRDLIIKSIENLNNLDSKDGNSISPGYLSGCKVYKTANKLEADYIVGITNSLNADYKVSVIGESLGTASCGIWYIQNSTIGADFTIAYVDRSLNPSLVVDFVSSKLELP